MHILKFSNRHWKWPTYLFFNFFGGLIHEAIKFHGSWHNIKLETVYGIYFLKLTDERNPHGYEILGHYEFVNSAIATNGNVLRGWRINETRDITESVHISAVDIIIQLVKRRERQRAEWGVREVKEPFYSLNRPLPTDCTKRFRLQNFFSIFSTTTPHSSD